MPFHPVISVSGSIVFFLTSFGGSIDIKSMSDIKLLRIAAYRLQYLMVFSQRVLLSVSYHPHYNTQRLE